MGNWVGKYQVVQPITKVKEGQDFEDVKRSLIGEQSIPPEGLRVKVKISTRRLKELMAQVDSTQKGNSELGQLILQECLDGRLSGRVVVDQDLVSKYDSMSLSTIKEE